MQSTTYYIVVTSTETIKNADEIIGINFEGINVYRDKVTHYAKAQDLFSTPNELSVFSYNYLKLSSVNALSHESVKINKHLFTKVSGCSCRLNLNGLFLINIKIHNKSCLITFNTYRSASSNIRYCSFLKLTYRKTKL